MASQRLAFLREKREVEATVRSREATSPTPLTPRDVGEKSTSA